MDAPCNGTAGIVWQLVERIESGAEQGFRHSLPLHPLPVRLVVQLHGRRLDQCGPFRDIGGRLQGFIFKKAL